ncbi:hypothetical protein IEO21_06624 [Rhodonia placenta]|uniref:Xylanolytic transcriptional activator regulatory domain-containing protein n=1 Tax=Rhodonia placenta TaxID=104341 RepID=A0A8H7U0F6_9APHY|nr:hypothetical protein IEO21_06624 [Postia placenta]
MACGTRVVPFSLVNLARGTDGREQQTTEAPRSRCDGSKPACQQCVRAKKGDACEYDDGKGKTRTQLMREHIARLEMRIKELENLDQTSPSITLFDPHAPSPYYSGSSSSSSHGSPSALSLPASVSPTPFPQEQDYTPTNNITEAYSPSEEPPFELAQVLLEIFLPHRHQCGLDIHVGRLRESLALPPSERRHPVLMNAIYLWACFLSRPGPLSEQEPHFLAGTLAAMPDALGSPAHAVDLVRATCLLALYYLANGRLFEGSHHAGVAAAMAVQFGLHQIDADDGAGLGDEWEAGARLPPPQDAVERGERILAFWQAYNLDRCWSVALRRPSAIPDSDHPWAAITTPWPQRMDEYECGLGLGWARWRWRLIWAIHFIQGEGAAATGSPTVRGFFAHRDQTAGFSIAAMRAKASALFEAANRLSSSWTSRTSRAYAFRSRAESADVLSRPVSRTEAPSASLVEHFGALEHTIAGFAATLLPLHQLSAAAPEDRFALLVVHSLAHAAVVRLHVPFMDSDPRSRDKCLRAARALALVTKHVADVDYDFLDPLLGPCWSSAAKVLEAEHACLQASWPPLNALEVRAELGAILFALTKLSARFPLVGYQAAKIQNFLESK